MMMGASNLMMGLTLVLVVCLAVVLALVLVLLAELYCSILLRRRQLQQTTTNATNAEPLTTEDNNPPPPPLAPPTLSNIYSQGVLAAPRNLLYPSVAGDDIEKQQQLPLPPENQESDQDGHIRKGCSGNSGRREEDLVYISNPMFDDENGRRSKAGNTPFETPDTSPSRLETEDSSGDDERDEITSLKVVATPPITPMKKLPAEVRSVASVKDGGGDSNSNNGASSSSSSGTPCTSLSW